MVTHGISDDSNSFATDGGPLWLRITRSGRVWAFHVSADGAYWDLVRYFSVGEGSGARIGFLAQSPMGHGCTAVFEAISYQVGAPANLRDGTNSPRIKHLIARYVETDRSIRWPIPLAGRMPLLPSAHG